MGGRITVWLTRASMAVTAGVGLVWGMVYGSKFEGLDIFVAVKPSLPFPWSHLPMDYQTYEPIYNILQWTFILLLLWLRFTVAQWKNRVVSLSLLSGLAVIVSVLVVAYGEREGPRWESGELILHSILAFLSHLFLVAFLFCAALVGAQLLRRVVNGARLKRHRL